MESNILTDINLWNTFVKRALILKEHPERLLKDMSNGKKLLKDRFMHSKEAEKSTRIFPCTNTQVKVGKIK